MRVAIYIRVSTEDQVKEGYSLAAQETILRREAEKLGAEVVDTYCDEGFSAKNMKRPALKRMISKFASDEFDAILFWRLDRLTRRSKDFHELTERMHSHGIGMVSVVEKIDTTSAIGRFQVELSVSLAQLERETISERVASVMEERARKGLRNGAPAALGYQLVNKSHAIDQEQAKIVKKIYDLYLAGTGFKMIAHIMLRHPNTATLLNWSGATIKYILQNPLYIGKLRWNYIDKNNKATGNAIVSDSDHVPIIDTATWNRVQEEIIRRGSGGKRYTSDHVFSSVLRCGRCGAKMQGFAYKHRDKRYKTYRCSNKIERGTCDFPNTREKGVSDAILRVLNLEQFDFNEVEMLDEDKSDQIKVIRSQLDKIEQRKKRWRIAFANELMSLDDLRDHLQTDKDLEDQLSAELKTLDSRSNGKWTRSELVDQMRALKESWDEIGDKAKKLFMQDAFEYLVIDVAPGELAGQGRRPKLLIRDFKLKLDTLE